MFLSAQVTAKEEDKKDIDAFLLGDRDGFEKLVFRHQDRIYNLCCNLLGDLRDAEEAAQETFVKAFRGIKGFRFESSFSTWLYTIAVNICRNKRNSAERRFWKNVLRFGQNPRIEEQGFEEIEFEDPAPSPLARIAEKERNALLQQAVETLSNDHRTVIVLRHMEELPYEEICRIMGYNLGTLKSKLARARVLLHNALQQELKRGGAREMLTD